MRTLACTRTKRSRERANLAGFAGTDPALFRKALMWLEEQDKAKIFKGAESDADGVKFF